MTFAEVIAVIIIQALAVWSVWPVARPLFKKD
jgi:hypothetical protein